MSNAPPDIAYLTFHVPVYMHECHDAGEGYNLTTLTALFMAESADVSDIRGQLLSAAGTYIQ